MAQERLNSTTISEAENGPGYGYTIDGRPLTPEEAAEVAEAIKNHRWHIVVELTGYSPWYECPISRGWT